MLTASRTCRPVLRSRLPHGSNRSMPVAPVGNKQELQHAPARHSAPVRGGHRGARSAKQPPPLPLKTRRKIQLNFTNCNRRCRKSLVGHPARSRTEVVLHLKEVLRGSSACHARPRHHRPGPWTGVLDHIVAFAHGSRVTLPAALALTQKRALHLADGETCTCELEALKNSQSPGCRRPHWFRCMRAPAWQPLCSPPYTFKHMPLSATLPSCGLGRRSSVRGQTTVNRCLHRKRGRIKRDVGLRAVEHGVHIIIMCTRPV